MKILVMRHGESGQGFGPDAHRFLTAHGRAQVLAVAERLAEQGLAPTAIYVSPLVRAVQTAELLARGTGHPGPIVTQEGLVPGSPAGPVLASLSGHVESDVVALVSHEPTVRTLGAALSGDPSFAHFATAEVAVFEGDTDVARLLSRLRA